MSKTTNKIKLLLSFFILFLSNTRGAEINRLENTDYSCFYNIVTKFNLNVNYQVDHNGYYNFCSLGTICNSGVVSVLNIDGQGKTLAAGAILEISDIECFSFANRISIRNLPINPAILYHKFNSVQYVNYQDVLGPNVGITQDIPPYTDFQLLSNDILNNTIVKLSNSYSVSSFSVGADCIYYDRGTPLSNNKLGRLSIYGAMNLPDLQDFIYLNNVFISLNAQYNDSTLSNYDNYFISKKGYLQIVWPSNKPLKPIPFFAKNNKNVSQLSLINANFIKPITIIDISQTTNYQSLFIQLLQKGDVFNINGEIPIIVNSSISLAINYGEISGFPKFNQYRQIRVTSSKLSTDLPKFTGSASMVDFSFNQITGTIDQSYCSTELIVVNNQLTGKIPSCFTCYMTGISNDVMDSRFYGNPQLTNTGSGLDCPTLAPIVTKVNDDSIIINGTDIGFDINNFIIDGYSCDPINSKVIQTGKSYLFYYLNLFSSNYVNITWKPLVPIKTFTFPLIVSSPFVTSIISTTSGIGGNSNLITIGGTYFSSYNGYKNQIIKVGGSSGNDVECEIKSTNFFEIVCETKEKLPLNQITHLLVTTDGLISKKVYFNTTDSFVNNLQCNNDCLNGGYCDLSRGICFCENGGEGIDCGGISCSPQCLNGICNTTIGECNCSSNYTGNDCSIPISIPCSNNCSGNGVCNTSNGECNCSSNYTGADCSISIPINIQCLNSCSGNGVCNTTIGECNCSSNYTGIDCSIPINIPCSNNCSGNGVCNTANGECSCSSNYTGIDCSTQVVPEKITCEYNNEADIHSLTIYSYVGINCTGTGPTYCVDNIHDATCKSNETNNIIECTVGRYNKIQLTSITCFGNNIVCMSSYIKCVVNKNSTSPQSFSVNDISQTSNMVPIKEINNDSPIITQLPSL